MFKSKSAMDVSHIFEKWNSNESITYTRECGCPYRFKPDCKTGIQRSRRFAFLGKKIIYWSMAIQSVRARDFWHKLERQKSLDEPDFFQRATTFRSSFNSSTAPLNTSQHGPVWGSIYCTMRDRSKGNRGRSSSASDSNNFQSERNGRLPSPRSTSTSERSTPSPGRTNYRKMPENEVECAQKSYSAPKRYETTCYFMPLAVPVWYSTSVSIKINSTKRNYKETVNYQNKLVPYRFVERMTTEICGNAPGLYVSEEIIEKKLPADEHYISLEPQQKSELNLDKPFTTNHHIAIENHT